MIKTIAAAVLGLALLATTSQAVTYTDNNPANVWLNAANKSYDGQFDLTGYGYNPVTETITSASLDFTLFDVLFNEGYKITVEGDQLFSGGSFSGTIDLGSGITGTLLGNLDADGILNYTVSRTSGEFWLANACLTAEAGPRSVPDGGVTMAMFGLGLVCVEGLRRKLTK